jgi:hypothetical protein
MSQNDELLLKLGQTVIALQESVKQQGETLTSLIKWLTNAFKEQGYDFAKIAMIESSRRREEIQNQTDVPMEPEEMDPVVQDELARKVLKLQQDPRALVNEASNKGRKQ